MQATLTERWINISIRSALQVWRRNFVLYRRTWLINLLPNFFEAPILLTGLGIGLGAYVGTSMGGMEYLAFLAPGLVVTNAMNGSTFETTYNVFVRLHFNRTYDAIIATPVSIDDAMLGEIFWATTRGTLYGTVFALMTIPFGVLGFAQLPLMLPVVVLASWLFAAVGLAFTSVIKVIDLYSFYFTLFLTPMWLFSGIFFPLDSLPPWVAQVAWFTPLFHVVNLAKATAHGGWATSHAIDVIWCVAVSTGLTIFAIRKIRGALLH